MAQQTTSSQGSPVLRGFTGQRNLYLIDGVRYNTAAWRDGPSQYLSWLPRGGRRSHRDRARTGVGAVRQRRARRHRRACSSASLTWSGPSQRARHARRHARRRERAPHQRRRRPDTCKQRRVAARARRASASVYDLRPGERHRLALGGDAFPGHPVERRRRQAGEHRLLDEGVFGGRAIAARRQAAASRSRIGAPIRTTRIATIRRSAATAAIAASSVRSSSTSASCASRARGRRFRRRVGDGLGESPGRRPPRAGAAGPAHRQPGQHHDGDGLHGAGDAQRGRRASARWSAARSSTRASTARARSTSRTARWCAPGPTFRTARQYRTARRVPAAERGSDSGQAVGARRPSLRALPLHQHAGRRRSACPSRTFRSPTPRSTPAPSMPRRPI